MWCRPDARLRHVNLFLPFEVSLQTPNRSSVILLGFREDYRLTSFLFNMQYKFIILVRITSLFLCIMLHLLYLMSKLSCEYIQSIHVACWFGQILTKAVWRLEESQSVPCDPGIGQLYHIRFCYPNKFIEPHSSTRWAVRFRSHVTHVTGHIHHHFYYKSVVMPPYSLCHIRLYV